MGSEIKIPRSCSSRAWYWTKEFTVYAWQRSTPIFVGLFGLAFGCLAVNEAREEAVRVGLFIAAGTIIWAIGLSYERGHAAGASFWGDKMAGMIAGDAETTITVTHIYKATPEAMALINADKEAAGRAALSGAETESDHG